MYLSTSHLSLFIFLFLCFQSFNQPTSSSIQHQYLILSIALHCMPSHLPSLHTTSSYYVTPLHSAPSYFTTFILLPLSIPHNVNVRLYIKKTNKRIVRTVHTARQYNVTVQCRNHFYNTANLNLIQFQLFNFLYTIFQKNILGNL